VWRRAHRQLVLTLPQDPGVSKPPLSRGLLVPRFLEGDADAAAFAATLSGAHAASAYGGFNMLCADLSGHSTPPQQHSAAAGGGGQGRAASAASAAPAAATRPQMWHVSNRAGGVASEVQAGLHAMSNGALLDEWPKMRRGRVALGPLLQGIQGTGVAYVDTRTMMPHMLIPHCRREAIIVHWPPRFLGQRELS
jgi:Transport and Golgi organisation 2